VLIRRCEPRDHEAVRTLLTASFEGDEPRLVERLRADPAGVPALTLIAEVSGAVAGVVVGSRAAVGGWPAVALGPLAVLPRFRGHGAGRALVRSFLLVAGLRGEPLVGTVGAPAFYGPLGFVAGASVGIVPEREDWVAAFQVATLPLYVPAQRGVFRYAAPFTA
jgi:putative acetyltransferase